MPTGLVLDFICGLIILIGLVGIAIPVLPGLLLCVGAVALWAIAGDEGTLGWVVLAACVGWFVLGTVVKFAWPGAQMKRSGVPTTTILLGVLLGLLGMLVVPIAGLVVGFIGGVWIAESRRLGSCDEAWPSTRAAVKAVGMSVLVELFAGVLLAGTWVLGVLVSYAT